MQYRNDESIQSANVPNLDNSGFEADHNLYRAMIIDVIYTDNTNNITRNSANPRVLYDVIIIGGRGEGQLLTSCRLTSIFAGSSNSYERVLKATSKSLTDIPLDQHDGDIVFIQFLQGHVGYPVIIALDESFTKTTPNATSEDGTRLLSQYNGVLTEINKDGEYCLIRKGGKLNTDTGLFEVTADDEVPNFEGKFKLLANQMIWEDPNSSISILKEEQMLIRNIGAEDAVVETIDGANETILRKFKSGLQILEDGKTDKVEITTNSGVSISIDGAGGQVILSQGATKIIMDGNSGKVSLQGSLVDLGASVSDFAVLFTQLLNTFNTHTHLVPQSPSGTLPSAVPTVPMTPAVRSTTVKVQS